MSVSASVSSKNITGIIDGKESSNQNSLFGYADQHVQSGITRWFVMGLAIIYKTSTLETFRALKYYWLYISRLPSNIMNISQTTFWQRNLEAKHCHCGKWTFLQLKALHVICGLTCYALYRCTRCSINYKLAVFATLPPLLSFECQSQLLESDPQNSSRL